MVKGNNGHATQQSLNKRKSQNRAQAKLSLKVKKYWLNYNNYQTCSILVKILPFTG